MIQQILSTTMSRIILSTLVFATIILISVQGFAIPKSEFLLDIDGNSITISHEHICAIEQKPGNEHGGRAHCWGLEDDSGRLDSPSNIDFVQLVSGWFFTCGVAVDQSVHCWGSISGIIPGLFTQLTSDPNGHFVCGLMIDKKIKCFGSMESYLIPQNRDDIRFAQISCSPQHCCALDEYGYPHCWGRSPISPEVNVPLITYQDFLKSKSNHEWLIKSDEDEFADENYLHDRQEAIKNEMKEPIQYRQISVAKGISCGITLLGSHILCWGAPKFFKSGYPKEVNGPFRQLSVSTSGICALTAEPSAIYNEDQKDSTLPASSSSIQREADQILCWGTIKQVIDRFPHSAYDQIKVGNTYICAVSMDSELQCWGYGLPSSLDRYHEKIIIA